MLPNILLSSPPETVEVAGSVVRLRTSFRVGIQAMRLMDNPLVDEQEAATLLLLLFFGRQDKGCGLPVLPEVIARHAPEALEAVSTFLSMGEPKPPHSAGWRGASAAMRTFCWDGDASRIAADFQREYGIDLTDLAFDMHWWRFWSLFRNLSASSQVMEVVGVRSALPDEKKMGREAADDLARRQMAVMLPARTQEEADQLTRLRFRHAMSM